MKSVRAFLCGVSLIGATGIALAQSAPATSGDAGKDRLFEQADTNRDGVIDRNEFAAAVTLQAVPNATGGATAPSLSAPQPVRPGDPGWLPSGLS